MSTRAVGFTIRFFTGYGCHVDNHTKVRVALGIQEVSCSTCKHKNAYASGCINFKLGWAPGWEDDLRMCLSTPKVQRFPGWEPQDG
jgi:hypothetical protein